MIEKKTNLVRNIVIAMLVATVLLFASCLIAPAKSYAADVAYVNYTFLNVRDFATVNSKKVGELHYGDKVYIGVHKDGFGKLRKGKFKGEWVSLDYLDFAWTNNNWYCNGKVWQFNNTYTKKTYKGHGWHNASRMLTSAGSDTNFGIVTDKGRSQTYVFKNIDGKWFPWKSSGNVIGTNGSTETGIFTIYKKTKSFDVANMSKNIKTECLYACWFKGHKSLHSPAVIKGTKKQVNGVKGVKGVKGIKGVKGVKGAKYGTTGCIRLSMSLSKWIYKHCPVGTRVINY